VAEQFGRSAWGNLYTSDLRRVVRRLGLTKFWGLAGMIRSAYWRRRYRKVGAGTVKIDLGGRSASFTFSSASELERAMRLDGERALLARMLRETRPGDVVFDVGANLGFYTVLLAKAVGPIGTVVAFEPELGVLERMKENAEINGVANIRGFNVALGETEATVPLEVDSRLGSGLHIMAGGDHSVRAGFATRDVRQVRGDAYVAAQALPVPALIKVDVEGMEREVLRGLARTLADSRCRLVLCEIHFGLLDRMGKPTASKDIEGLLSHSGFNRIEWPDRSHILALKLAG